MLIQAWAARVEIMATGPSMIAKSGKVASAAIGMVQSKELVAASRQIGEDVQEKKKKNERAC